MNAIFNVIVEYFKWSGKLNPLLSKLITLSVVMLSFWSFLREAWGSLFAKIDALVIPALPGGADFSPLGLCNYVFPLDTMLTYCVSLMALKLVCSGIRVVKSFVPTVA